MDTKAAVRGWIDGWSRGWTAHDPETVAALYADDAVFLLHPFREPVRGSGGAREYARQAFADEDDVEFWFGEPVVGERRAAVEYWAFIRAGGKEWTLAGTSVLRFGEDGRAIEHRDYWAMDEGRRERPAGWGAST